MMGRQKGRVTASHAVAFQAASHPAIPPTHPPHPPTVCAALKASASRPWAKAARAATISACSSTSATTRAAADEVGWPSDAQMAARRARS